MNLAVTCLRDKLSGFGNPSFSLTLPVAERNFIQLCESQHGDGDRLPFVPAEDLELYNLGSFDSETGLFDLLDRPVLLLRGEHYVSD